MYIAGRTFEKYAAMDVATFQSLDEAIDHLAGLLEFEAELADSDDASELAIDARALRECRTAISHVAWDGITYWVSEVKAPMDPHERARADWESEIGSQVRTLLCLADSDEARLWFISAYVVAGRALESAHDVARVMLQLQLRELDKSCA